MEKNSHKQSCEINEMNTLVNNHSDFLFKYALYRIRNQAVIQDLLQETFLSALKSYQNFKGISSERTWLVSILKHKIADYYRKQEKEKKMESFLSGTSESEEISDSQELGLVIADPYSRDPSAVLEQKEMMEALGQCIEQLPSRQQDALILHELEEIDSDAICKKLNISHSNLWVMLHRARVRLRTCMKSKSIDKGVAL